MNEFLKWCWNDPEARFLSFQIILNLVVVIALVSALVILVGWLV